jgi:tRNA1(Val) A37 N6-methylase TrmN6
MAAANLTDDAFLGGRLNLLQPKTGFRSGLDAVMLAASIQAKPRQHVCDVGAGAGAALMCLAARVPDLEASAVEIDPVLADLASQNHVRNGLTGSLIVHEADVLMRPRSVPRQAFHHVMSNPPFHDAARGTPAPERAKARAKALDGDGLLAWLRFCRALVRPKGTVTVILPPAQLPAAMTALTRDGLGAVVIPLWPKAGVPAKRVILRVLMNSSAPLQLQPGLVLHEDDGRATSIAEQILRGGGALTT